MVYSIGRNATERIDRQPSDDRLDTYEDPVALIERRCCRDRNRFRDRRWPARPLPSDGRRSSCRLLAVATALMLLAVGPLSAAEVFSPSDPLAQRLMASMTSLVEGQPFRKAIEDLANPAGVNVCIDRHVDPTAPVSAGQVGPSVYLAIEQVANQRECVVMPVTGVLLVGRPAWVDRTSLALMEVRGNQATNVEDRIDIRWVDLTTPTEALKLALGDPDSTATLPHDLWPRSEWRDIDRRVAVSLILSQFDRKLSSPQRLQPFQTVPMVVAKPNDSIVDSDRHRAVTWNYAIAIPLTRLRSSFATSESARIRRSRRHFAVTAQASDHRAAIASLLTSGATPAVETAGDRADAVYQLTLNAIAAEALQQLAKMAGRRCVIESSATDACQNVVRIEGQSTTLRRLIDQIAQQVGVRVIWSDDEIRVL